MPDSQDTPQVTGDPQRGTSLTLLQRLRANEPDAWRTMVQLYTPLLYQWCARSALQGADADDVLQEVFRAAATHLDGFRRDRPGDSFRGWLRAITRNMILLHFRKSGRQPEAGGGTAPARSVIRPHRQVLVNKKSGKRLVQPARSRDHRVRQECQST